MNRKDFLKNISAVGAIALLPKIELSAKPIQHPKFHFIGLGSAGNKALLEFRKHIVNGTFTAINIDLKEHVVLSKNKKIDSCYWHKKRTEEESWDEIKSQLQEQSYDITNTNDHFVLLAGLGGVTGTALLTIISSMLQIENKKYTIICTVPYNFEGTRPSLASYQFIKENKINKNVNFIFADTFAKKYPGLKMIDCFSALDTEMLKMWLQEKQKFEI